MTILFLGKNTDKESQVVEALNKSLPALVIVIITISVLAAVFYAWYITAPIKKISKVSKRMANMDFNSLCPVGRTDEIGVLSDSLNVLSGNLSAASHELKTPITIIKSQLQGMLCGVGRYKDRETYLAQSFEVTNSLEKMMQELLATDNGDISELLDAQTEVLANISRDDENYEFITVTLAASLEEVYCEQMNDSVGTSAYLKKEGSQFVFNALYRLSYTFSEPTQITIAERDRVLQRFKTEFQNYVDGLSEASLTNFNIKTVLSEKADELERSLSTAKIKLSCEVQSVEVHNDGTEMINN